MKISKINSGCKPLLPTGLFILSALLFNGCYIARYHQIKEDLARLRKQASSENRRYLSVKSLYEARRDSVDKLTRETEQYIAGLMECDRKTDSITQKILRNQNAFTQDQITAASTAGGSKTHHQDEKLLFVYLNLARMYPGTYAEIYLSPYLKGSGSGNLNVNAWNTDTIGVWYAWYYEKSLYLDLKKMNPAQALTPDEACRVSAECHALSTGREGLVTHDRQKGCKAYFAGECCFYGNTDPEYVILGLLIDEGVLSLGHRSICLSGSFSRLGTAIRPHKGFGKTSVLDFK